MAEQEKLELNSKNMRYVPEKILKLKVCKVLDLYLDEMKKADKEGKLNEITVDDIALYNLDETEINRDISLYEGAKFSDARKGQFQPFIIDFKNVIILRLMGDNEFIYVKFTE